MTRITWTPEKDAQLIEALGNKTLTCEAIGNMLGASGGAVKTRALKLRHRCPQAAQSRHPAHWATLWHR